MALKEESHVQMSMPLFHINYALFGVPSLGSRALFGVGPDYLFHYIINNIQFFSEFALK